MRYVQQQVRFKRTRELPKRVLKPIAEGIRKLKSEHKSLKNLDEKQVFQSNTAQDTVKRRFFYCIAVSEIVGTFIGAPIGGAAAQYSTGDAYNGILGTIAGDYFPAVAMICTCWHHVNRKYYAHFDSAWTKTKKFLKDVLSLNTVTTIAALPAYLASAALSAGYVKAAELFSERFAHGFPVAVVEETLNYVIAEAIYLFTLFKISKFSLDSFTKKYKNYLDKEYGE